VPPSFRALYHIMPGMAMSVRPLVLSPLWGYIDGPKSRWNGFFNMAESGLTQRLGYLSDRKQEIPVSSRRESIKTDQGEFVNLFEAGSNTQEPAFRRGSFRAGRVITGGA
jgi:hypothetical protein